MAHDASNNNPTKETLAALVGIALLLVMIAGIAVSAWLRPAGEHQPTAPVEAAAEVAPAAEEAPAANMQASDAAVAEAQQKLEQTGDNTQAPTQATATEDKPAAESAPAETTNAAPVAETAEQKAEAQAAVEATTTQ